MHMCLTYDPVKRMRANIQAVDGTQDVVVTNVLAPVEARRMDAHFHVGNSRSQKVGK